MLFLDLVHTSSAVAAVSGRLEKIRHLAELIARLTPEEVLIAVPFLSGALRQGRLGVGAAVIRAARDVPPASTATLTIGDVDRTFQELAAVTGAGSTRARQERLRSLFAVAAADEQTFLVKLLFGELRQGALEGVLVDGVARAAKVPPAGVRRAAMLAGDLAPVARAVLTEGADGLAGFHLQLLQPVQPMLADAADDVESAVTELGDATLEYKLDGARVQVHKAADLVRVYSRNLREVTPAVPEVVEAVSQLPVESAILDGEVIVLKPDGSPVPFQDTMRRFGRRLDVDALRRTLPLTPFFFDVLALDGRDVIDESQSTRFNLLTDVVPSQLVIPHATSVTTSAARAFLDEALARGHEGVMAKSRAAPYAAGSRGSAWLKVKAVRTLDLVVLAAEWGNGRRQGWLSNLHLGARNPAGGFVMLGKTFKGMTDDLLAWQTKELLAREVGRDSYTVYVRPELVVEIAFNDLQASSQYPGGLALRFARVKRYRTDKTAGEADTIDTVRSIYREATGKG
jgi:ATP-dependent DNA ligase I